MPLLARALGLKAECKPSARATIGYLVYKHLYKSLEIHMKENNKLNNANILFLRKNNNSMSSCLIYVVAEARFARE